LILFLFPGEEGERSVRIGGEVNCGEIYAFQTEEALALGFN